MDIIIDIINKNRWKTERLREQIIQNKTNRTKYKEIFYTKLNRGLEISDEELEQLSPDLKLAQYQTFYGMIEIVPLRLYECNYCHDKKYLGEPFLTCGKCRSVHYCSKECQDQKWFDHKKDCTNDKKENAEILNNIIYSFIREDNLDFIYRLIEQIDQVNGDMTSMDNLGLAHEIVFSKNKALRFPQGFLTKSTYRKWQNFRWNMDNFKDNWVIPINFHMENDSRAIVLCCIGVGAEHYKKNRRIIFFGTSILAISICIILLGISILFIKKLL